MAQLYYFLLFIEIALIIPSQQSVRHGFEPELLHADNERSMATIIEPEMLQSFIHSRNKREVKTSSSETGSSQPLKPDKPPSPPNSDLASKNTPNAAQITVVRTNVTVLTINNITTMVSIFLCLRIVTTGIDQDK